MTIYIISLNYIIKDGVLMKRIMKDNVLMKRIGREVKLFYWSTFVLFISAFIYSGGLFLLNVFLPWNEVGGEMYDETNLDTTRIFIRKSLEVISNVGVLIYFIVMLVIFWQLYLKKAIPKISVIIRKYFIITLGVSVCTLPFSLSNLTWIVDYAYPLLNSSSTLSILVIIAFILRYCMLTKVK